MLRKAILPAGAALAVLTTNLWAQAMYTNPVLPGDHADPSIIRVGKDYWATCTSSAWGPMFPLYHSQDLINWEPAGAVVPHQPDWATGDYWAPEISEYKGKFYVYFVARERGGRLAIAVATAGKPEGPYEVHEPLIAQPAGSIDPVPVVDTNGVRYLVWKEDGNSQNQPTPIWLQPLSEDGTKLVGQPVELIRNQPGTWEGNLVEGPYILRRNDWYYMFYSGNGCCGNGCTYALGVARAHSLQGPWEKNPANPILAGNQTWHCPGHGSIVDDGQGRYFLLYHAYPAAGTMYVGREGLLDEVTFGADDWPVIGGGKGPGVTVASPLGAAQKSSADKTAADFGGKELAGDWQWPHQREPRYHLGEGKLHLLVDDRHPGFLSAVLARSITAPNYAATTAIETSQVSTNVAAGLCAFGDLNNAVGVVVKDGMLIVWRRDRGQLHELQQQPAPAGGKLFLRMESRQGFNYQFAVSVDGEQWIPCGAAVEAKNLPPWDRGVRVALTAGGGAADAEGVFDGLSLKALVQP